jgi:hypothetical protein
VVSGGGVGRDEPIVDDIRRKKISEERRGVNCGKLGVAVYVGKSGV